MNVFDYVLSLITINEAKLNLILKKKCLEIVVKELILKLIVNI